MGIFSRMGDIINSNLNAMIDKAEDPEKIARLIIQEMEDTLIEVRTEAARNIAERKELTRKAEEYTARADEWGAKAELALSKDREDLARGALSAKQQAEAMSEVVIKEIGILDEAVDKADADLSKLQTKLDEAKAKHKALMMRTTVARGQIKMRTVLKDTKVDDLGAGQSLENQFAELEANDAIEDELAALKARLGGKTAKTNTKKSG